MGGRGDGGGGLREEQLTGYSACAGVGMHGVGTLRPGRGRGSGDLRGMETLFRVAPLGVIAPRVGRVGP